MRIQHLADYGSSSTHTTSRLWALDKDWLDQLKVMPKRGASESEILLMLHECADGNRGVYGSADQCISHLILDDRERITD